MTFFSSLGSLGTSNSWSCSSPRLLLGVQPLDLGARHLDHLRVGLRLDHQLRAGQLGLGRPIGAGRG